MNTERKPSRAGWMFLLIVALLTGIAIVSYRSGERHAATKLPQGSIPGTANASNAAAALTPPQVAAQHGPGVAEVLRLMQQWRQQNPVYHMMVETTSDDASSTADVFRYRDDKGLIITRVRSSMVKPSLAKFLINSEGGTIQAYFPASNQLIDLNTDAAQKNLLAAAGWAGGPADATLLLKLARASFVELGPDFQALTMVFNGSVFGMPPAAGDLFVTMKLDPTGKTLAVEQLTLGTRIISKITYVPDDAGAIAQAAPKIPADAKRVAKSFNQVMQEEVNLQKTKPVTI